MNRLKLRYADGREEIGEDFDPTATIVVRQTSDGKMHHFRATDEIDDDGYDVYVEELQA
jgi:hypothetical protein